MTRMIGNDEENRDSSLMAIDQYFRQIHWTAALTQEETMALLEQVARGRGESGSLSVEARAALDRLVEGHQRLVVHIASRMLRQCRSMALEDLIQEGSIGLIQAIEHYEAAEVRSVSGWFGKHIHDAIVWAIIEQDAPVRYTHRQHWELLMMQRAEERLHQTLRRVPTLAEVAADMQVSESKVWEWRACRGWRETKSLQGLLAEDEDEGRRDFVSLFEAYVSQADWRSERVREAVATALTRREQQAIRSRYGMREEDGREQTHAEIAVQWGVCESAVARAEQSAYERLYPVLATSCQIAVEAERVMHVCMQCGREYPHRFCGRRQDEYCCDKCRGAARRLRQQAMVEVA